MTFIWYLSQFVYLCTKNQMNKCNGEGKNCYTLTPIGR